MSQGILIGLSGYAQTGKDTVADFLVRDHGFTRVAFADKLKAVAYDLNPFICGGPGGMRRLQAEVNDFGWDAAKQRPEIRRILQALGGGIRDHVHDQTWINAAIGSGATPGQRVVVTDVRYPNEAAAIRFRHGQIVRISRFGVEPVNGHISETAMDDERLWDAHILNDSSLEHLQATVERFVASFEVREAV